VFYACLSFAWVFYATVSSTAPDVINEELPVEGLADTLSSLHA
jgi:hypothetical protein